MDRDLIACHFARSRNRTTILVVFECSCFKHTCALEFAGPVEQTKVRQLLSFTCIRTNPAASRYKTGQSWAFGVAPWSLNLFEFQERGYRKIPLQHSPSLLSSCHVAVWAIRIHTTTLPKTTATVAHPTLTVATLPAIESFIDQHARMSCLPSLTVQAIHRETISEHIFVNAF